MDNKSLGGAFGIFGHSHSAQEYSIPASTNCDSTATAYEASQRSNQLSICDDGCPNRNEGKKKRVSKIVGGGLRQISITVGNKVESKGRTTYSEVADEIVAEFTESNNSAVSLDKVEEKNIRRRVYDALNVLMALDVIVKEGKEIRWKGLPSTDVKDMEQNKALREKLMNQIGKKAAYLKELEEQTNPHATVEIEISEDMQLVHFDFNSTPFSLHDDAYILKLLRGYQPTESRHNSQTSSVLSSSSSDIASGGTKSFCWNSEIDMSK
ncbi:hypothetical protein Vadar_029315 [Vaccinium darrowii]|uniref:Uncharacterized protein n=1 Tax=Vaccinium darrowii TaxID=229202 RepID=A0ACB7ZM58_9ERIC|nr:hypothetical protein Vadar_029315 [Vaccinium darrowii]